MQHCNDYCNFLNSLMYIQSQVGFSIPLSSFILPVLPALPNGYRSLCITYILPRPFPVSISVLRYVLHSYLDRALVCPSHPFTCFKLLSIICSASRYLCVTHLLFSPFYLLCLPSHYLKSLEAFFCFILLLSPLCPYPSSPLFNLIYISSLSVIVIFCHTSTVTIITLVRVVRNRFSI